MRRQKRRMAGWRTVLVCRSQLLEPLEKQNRKYRYATDADSGGDRRESAGRISQGQHTTFHNEVQSKHLTPDATKQERECLRYLCERRKVESGRDACKL